MTRMGQPYFSSLDRPVRLTGQCLPRGTARYVTQNLECSRPLGTSVAQTSVWVWADRIGSASGVYVHCPHRTSIGIRTNSEFKPRPGRPTIFYSPWLLSQERTDRTDEEAGADLLLLSTGESKPKRDAGHVAVSNLTTPNFPAIAPQPRVGLGPCFVVQAHRPAKTTR